MADDRTTPAHPASAAEPTESRPRHSWPEGPGIQPDRAPVRPPGPETPTPADPVDDPDDRATLFGVFGGVRRSGAWEPPARLRVYSLFGGVDLDFCEAELLEGETEVEILAVFGGVEVRVPRDIDVVTEGVGVFGHFGQKDQRGDDPQPPRLRVKGLALFGGVDVKGPRTPRRSRWRRGGG